MATKNFFTRALGVDFGNWTLNLDASGTPFTANRLLSFDTADSDRTISLSGNLSIANNFTTSGNFPLTLTTTGSTNVTFPTSGTLAVTGSNTFTGNQTISAAGSTSSAQLVFSGTTMNWVDFGILGSAAPAFTTRSAGTKIVLSNTLSGSAADFALGMESGAMWFSAAGTGNSFKWYGGTTTAMTLTGGGNLTTTGSLTVGSGITSANNYLTLANPGIGFGNGFSFTRGTDQAGINVIETASDTTLYEIWMGDNPDGTSDAIQFRWTDWQGANSMVVPFYMADKSVRVVGSLAHWGTISQQGASNFYTTANTSAINGADKLLQFNTIGKLRVVGSTVDINAFDVTGYSATSGNSFWIKLDTTTTFAWGYGSVSTGTATATGIALSTSPQTLANGVSVGFTATTGAVGDAWHCRIYKGTTSSPNALGSTNITGVLNVSQTTANAINASLASMGSTADTNFKLVVANGSGTNGTGQEVANLGVRYNSGSLLSGFSFIRGASSTNSYFDFYSDGSVRGRLTGGGNLLIGTTTDDGISKLQVSGQVMTTASVNLSSGSTNGAGSGGVVLGLKFAQANPGTATNYKIATLPVSNAATFEHLVLEGVFDSGWGSANKTTFKILVSNRNALIVQYEKGAARQSHIDMYTEADGSVSVWLVMDASTYTSATVNMHGVGSSPANHIQLYHNPSTGTPTGTLSFSTATASPIYQTSSGGRFIIGSGTDDGVNKLQVNGLANFSTDVNVNGDIYVIGGDVRIRNSGTGAFNFVERHSGTMTADRSLNWDLGDVSRNITLGGNITTAGSFTISGAFATTLTVTGATTLTLPTSGTVIATASMQGGRSYLTHDFSTYIQLYETKFINPTGSTNLPTGYSGNGYLFGMGAGDVASRGFELLGSSSNQLWYRERGSGAWIRVAGTDPTQYGTGQTSYATGDMLYASATNALSKRAIGTTGQALTVSGGVPTWSTLDMSYLPDAVFKKSVKAATTSTLTITARASTTLTVGGTALTLDGVSLANTDRVLVKDNTTGVAGAGAADNGIYSVSGIGTSVVLTRVVDADISSEIAGAVVGVDQGTVNGGQLFTTTFKTTDTLGTTSMLWYQNYTSQQSATANTANTLVLRDGSGNFSAGTITATSFSGSGASLTSLNASNLSSGTVATARLGSGSAYNASFLRGDGTWARPGNSIVASAVNTAGTDQNKWARLAALTITAQFGDANISLDITGLGTGSGTSSFGRVYVRVKQQNAMAGVPVYSLYCDGLVVLDPTRLALVIVQNDASATVAELWIKAPLTFETIYAFERFGYVSSGSINYYTGSTYQAALPAGSFITADPMPGWILNSGTGDFGINVSHNGTLTANRNLSWNLNDADRTVNLSGNLTLAGNLTTAGANSITLTTTAPTSVTLPTTGTLATVADTLALVGGYPVSASNTDLNSYTTTTAFLRGTNMTNAPDLGWWQVLVQTHDSGTLWVMQTAWAYQAGTPATTATTMYKRARVNGVWTAWNKIIDSNSLILANTLTTSGNFAVTLTSTGTTNVTLPTTGTLATLAGTETLTNKTMSTGSTWNGNAVPVANGGTGATTALSARANLAAATYTADTAAPSNPNDGDKWLNTTTGIEFTYVDDGTSAQWVELGGTLVTQNGAQTYISDTQPTDSGPYFWIQTGTGSDGTGVMLWFNV
jgi:hypothetical protein